MVFFVSYRRHFGATKFQTNLRRTFFAVHKRQPSREEIVQLVDYVSHGEFAPSSIEFQRCIGFDPEELKKSGVTMYRFCAVRKESTRRNPNHSRH